MAIVTNPFQLGRQKRLRRTDAIRYEDIVRLGGANARDQQIPVTPTPSVTPTNTETPTCTPSLTQTITPTITQTPTPSVTIGATPTTTTTQTPTFTPTPSQTNTQTPTNTPTPSQTLTSTPTRTASVTSTPTPTITNTSTPTQTLTPTVTPTLTPTPSITASTTPTPSITSSVTPTVTQTLSPTQTPTNTVTPTITPTVTPTINYEDIAREEVVVFYNINSSESIEVANYYTANRPTFSKVNKVGLNIISPIYPQRRNSSGTVIISESGADVNVPYEGCRKYDLINEVNYKTHVSNAVVNYINNNPDTNYIVFSIDMPLLITNTAATEVPYLTSLVSGLSGLTYKLKTDTGIFPFHLNAQYKEDMIAYIDKLSRAQSEGIYLYNHRLCAYAEDSNLYGSTFYNLPDNTYNNVKDFYLYRSGRTTQTLNRPNTGIFCDQSSKWPHATGNLSGGEISYFGTWGFNGRRYIYPNGPYQYNINGEEVAGLSALSYFMDPGSSGKLTFNNPEKKDGWYFIFTFESFNGAMGGGSYGPYSGLVPSWGSFPSSYTGVKTFSAFMNSTEYRAGLRPIKHSHYCQYFSPSAFGGSRYENTPITWVGHLYEPGWGVLGVNHINSWLQGDTAYTTVSSNLYAGVGTLLCIGDPLVYVRTPIYKNTPTPTVPANAIRRIAGDTLNRIDGTILTFIE